MSEPREYVTKSQAADLAKVSVRSITEWLKAGKITKHKAENGFHVRIDKAELLAFDAWRRGIAANQLTMPDAKPFIPEHLQDVAPASLPGAGRFG
jgi:excisionase family DNA binding protein